MNEPALPLPLPEPARWLFAVPLALLIGAMALAVFAVRDLVARRVRRSLPAPPRPLILAITFTALASAAVALFLAAGALVGMPGTASLFGEVGRRVAIGGLDLGLGVFCDARSALACSFLLAAGGAALLFAVSEEADARRGARAAAAGMSLLAGLVVFLVSDDAFAALFGETLASLGAVGMPAPQPLAMRPSDVEGLRPTRVFSASALLATGTAFAVLYWTLGGAWVGADYAPDLSPRVIAARVARGLGPPPPPEGCFTVSAFAGAHVLVADDNEDGPAHPTPPRTAPFRCVPMPPGHRAVRIEERGGAGATLVPDVPGIAGAEVVLVPVGPTGSLHRVRDQFALRGRDGERLLHDAWTGKRGPLGISAQLWTFVSFGIAMLAFAAAGLLASRTAIQAKVAATARVGATTSRGLAIAPALFPFAACVYSARVTEALVGEGRSGAAVVLFALSIFAAVRAVIRLTFGTTSEGVLGRGIVRARDALGRGMAYLAGLALDTEELLVQRVHEGAIRIFDMIASVAFQLDRATFRRFFGGFGSGIIVFAALAALFGAPKAAYAASGQPLVLRAMGGGEGPTELSRRVLPSGATVFEGRFTVQNTSDEAATISRIAPRATSALEQAGVEPTLTATIESSTAPAQPQVEGGGSASASTIAPGSSLTVLVRYSPPAGSRLRQLYSHLVLTTSRESAGEMAMGVTARLVDPPRGLAHPLTWMIVLPLVVAGLLLMLGARAQKYASAALLSVLVALAFLVLRLYSTFDGSLQRDGGNDGLAYIDRFVFARSLGIEWFVGLDGIGLASLLAIIGVGFAGAVFGFGARGPGAAARYLAFLATATGAVVAQDAFLLVGCVGALGVVLGFAPDDGDELGGSTLIESRRLALPILLAALFFAAGLFLLHRHGGRAFLVDGTRVDTPFSIPDLARADFAHKTATFLGAPVAAFAWALLLAGVLSLMSVVPMHAFAAAAHDGSPSPGALTILTAGSLVPLGGGLAMRLLVLLLPDTTRDGAGIICAFGALS